MDQSDAKLATVKLDLLVDKLIEKQSDYVKQKQRENEYYRKNIEGTKHDDKQLIHRMN